MIINTGIDLIENQRIAVSLKNPRFMTRVFSEKEQLLFKQKNNSLQSIAANFAGKEAFSKAIGTGIRDFSFTDVSILRDDLGKPYLHFTGKAKEIVSQLGYQFSVSITHTKNYASCVVIAYKD